MEPIRLTERVPLTWADKVEEWTPEKIREMWSGDTPETSLVLALLARAERGEAVIGRLENEVASWSADTGCPVDTGLEDGCSTCHRIVKWGAILRDARAVLAAAVKPERGEEG